MYIKHAQQNILVNKEENDYVHLKFFDLQIPKKGLMNQIHKKNAIHDSVISQHLLKKLMEKDV